MSNRGSSVAILPSWIIFKLFMRASAVVIGNSLFLKTQDVRTETSEVSTITLEGKISPKGAEILLVETLLKTSEV